MAFELIATEIGSLITIAMNIISRSKKKRNTEQIKAFSHFLVPSEGNRSPYSLVWSSRGVINAKGWNLTREAVEIKSLGMR